MEKKENNLEIRKPLYSIRNGVIPKRELAYSIKDGVVSIREPLYSIKDEGISRREPVYSIKDDGISRREPVYSIRDENSCIMTKLIILMTPSMDNRVHIMDIRAFLPNTHTSDNGNQAPVHDIYTSGHGI